MAPICERKVILFSLVLIAALFHQSSPHVGGNSEEGSSGESATSSETFECGTGNLSATVGRWASLYSPNYPNNYPTDSECWWTITAPVGQHIQINFTTIQIIWCAPTFYDCYEEDQFQLFNAPSSTTATGRFLNLLEVDVLSRSFWSDFNYVTLRFKSINSIQDKGFELMYKAVGLNKIKIAKSFFAVIACPSLLTPDKATKLCYIDIDGKGYCSFSCNIGFSLSGSQNRTCLSNGSWTGNPVTCHKITSCPEWPIIDNGKKSCSDGNYVGSTCSFICDHGYKLFGTEYRTCDLEGLWQGSTSWEPSCQGSPPTRTCSFVGVEVCDGKYDCPDRSDEKGCTCPRSSFKCDCYESGCQLLFGCIRQSQRCDGKNDCGDWSDERDCQCSDTKFQCKYGNCVDRSKVNDGNTDCVDGDDESNCNLTHDHVYCDCLNENEQCAASGRCIPIIWIGDTIPDCENHSDEPCNASKVWCDECWVTINQCSTSQSKDTLLRNLRESNTKCHRVTISLVQKQTFETNWICITSPCEKCLDTFQCESGQFINNDYFCDETAQCYDGSDEDLKPFGFRCSGKSRTNYCVLPQKNVFDSVAQCADSSDLCFVNGEFRCFSCLDEKLIISAKQVCDGRVDCYDMSDECLCANQSVCNTVLGEEVSRCPSNQMHCNSDKDCVDMERVLCNSSVGCMNDSNLMFCHKDQRSIDLFSCTDERYVTWLMDAEPPKITKKRTTLCDGRPECWGMEDECQCEPRPSFCDGQCGLDARGLGTGHFVCDGLVNAISINSSCSQAVERNCPMRFNCKSKGAISIDKRYVCDGKFDCDDHSDEISTECINRRFYCRKDASISIEKTFVCDGIKDCDDGEDETHLECGEKRFFCDSGEPLSVDKKLLENGVKDCSDGSDECISLFSDRYEMISNPVLRGLFWIMGLLALCGNIVINVFTAKDIFFCESNNVIKLANDIFILNLTVSDFLMGVYLIAVVSQGVKYSGGYCFVDKKWRSSILCSGLGTLAVLSSETSAFIMAVMSTFRLVSAYKPFLASFIKSKWIVIAVGFCWFLSILISTIPWVPFQSGYFVSHVWFSNLFLKTDSASKSDMLLLASRLSGDSPNNMSWFHMKQIIADVFQHSPIKGEFGYYGETSVCMPRFYASIGEAAWQYSAFLITLNLMLFIYMVVAYALVYKKASGMKQSRSTKKDPNKGMQKRISRLLLTDLCCWIPVCIMGYLSLAGVPLPSNAYIASAGFLLPINSATNPILYSRFIGLQASRARKSIAQKFSCTCSHSDAGKWNSKTHSTELRVIEVTDKKTNLRKY